MFMVVLPKPLEMDFTYVANKPIELSDDEDDTEGGNEEQGCAVQKWRGFSYC